MIRSYLGQTYFKGSLWGKLLSTERQRKYAVNAQQKLGVSQRRVCKVSGIYRSVLRYECKEDNEAVLRADIIRLATQYERYGYRRIHALLQIEGWRVNHKRVERLWLEEGLKVPKKQPKKGRLYLNDGSCIRLRPCWKNHVWSYDFVADLLFNGKKYACLPLSMNIHVNA